MFHSTKRSSTLTDGEEGSSYFTLFSMESLANASQPLRRLQAFLCSGRIPRVWQGTINTRDQSETNSNSLLPGSIPSVLSCNLVLWVLCHFFHRLVSLPATFPYRQNVVNASACRDTQSWELFQEPGVQRSPHVLRGQMQREILFPSPRTTDLNAVRRPWWC